MKILIACEYSGIVRDAFTKKGHDVTSCDILPTESKGKHYQGDVFDILYDGWDMMIAHPPCTHLSVTGQRWFKEGVKPKYLQDEALDFVRKLMNAPINKIAIENPLSIISGRIRKSDQTIQPYQFGHLEQKRTCLWLKNLPKLKETNNVHDEMMKLPLKVRTRIHWLGGKGKERSKFYTGIANAMADQWSEPYEDNQLNIFQTL